MSLKIAKKEASRWKSTNLHTLQEMDPLFRGQGPICFANAYSAGGHWTNYLLSVLDKALLLVPPQWPQWPPGAPGPSPPLFDVFSGRRPCFREGAAVPDLPEGDA